MTSAHPPPELLTDTIETLGSDGRLVHLHRVPPTLPSVSGPTGAAQEALLERLRIDGLWSHQAEAVDRLTSGESLVIASGTGSGKSLCYQLPIIEGIERHPGSTALVIYPTKALAHDQLRSFASLEVTGLRPATYDGDTPAEQRLWIRRNANVILTNPEMLHLGILPNHQRWSSFLSQLRYVVIDELHVFRGIFGTHVGHVLRRLRRVAAHHGSKPTFAFTSATIGDPDHLASDLIASPVSAIIEDGSPSAEKFVGLWSGNAADPDQMSSPNTETAMLASEFIGRGYRTLSFCRSRQGTEAVTQHIKERLPPELSELVCSYRGGHLASERREVEDQLFSQELMGVVATSALELGIDVGGLDVAVVNGFPGTVSSFRQQIGRVGRRNKTSLAVLVAGSDQLDQWFIRNPMELFERKPERVVINPDNPFVLRPHLACAGHELPLSAEDDHELWGDTLDDGVRDLVHVDLMAIRNRRAMWTHTSSPAREISLRSGGSGEVRIVDQQNQLVGTVDSERAASQVHVGARYIHQGTSWEITELDLIRREAKVALDTRGSIRTHALSNISIDILEVFEHRRADSGTKDSWDLHLGSVEVREQVTRFQVKDRQGRVVEDTPLELPPTQLVTTALWITFTPELITRVEIEPKQLAGALHAIEHAAIGVLPLFTICDRWDVGGVSTVRHHQTLAPTIFIHDGTAGGAGVAPLGFDQATSILTTAASIISDCDCESGCPGCVQSPKCGNGNEPLDKSSALVLLRSML